MDYFSLFRLISDYPTKIDIEVINGIKLDNDWLVQQDKRFMIFCKAWNLYEVMNYQKLVQNDIITQRIRGSEMYQSDSKLRLTEIQGHQSKYM